MVSENISLSLSISSSLFTAEHAVHFAYSTLTEGHICTGKPEKAELRSDSTGEGRWAEPPRSQVQKRRSQEAKSYVVLPWWMY